MRKYLLASAALLPSVALAQQPPAIQANAAATAGITAAPPIGSNTSSSLVEVPPGMPPTSRPLSPSAPLNQKEREAVRHATRWRDRNSAPSAGEDGVVRWPYGASQPSVVCAPLQVCDIAFEPGETITAIHAGDKSEWSIMPAVTGFGAERTTHMIVKPTDSGLISSVLVFTDKRTYSIKLVSTQKQWTPLTGFTYQTASQDAWSRYGASAQLAGNGTQGGGLSQFNYTVSGSAPWRPEHIYSQTGKTYIVFPGAMSFGTAPALIGLANDGGWFSSPSEQMVRYRIAGNQYVVDGIIDHAMLVQGGGGDQQRVDIERHQ
jgi:P-type conjugative transfer protein TrbG